MPSLEVLNAFKFLNEHEISLQAFREVIKQPGVSGWAVARALGAQPEVVDDALKQLRDHKLLKTAEPGLNGNYVLTGVGFDLRHEVAG